MAKPIDLRLPPAPQAHESSGDRANSDADSRWISMPNAKKPRVQIRMRQAGEWTPNGRAILLFGTSGRLSETKDALHAPWRDRLKNAEYPMHTGEPGVVSHVVV